MTTIEQEESPASNALLEEGQIDQDMMVAMNDKAHNEGFFKIFQNIYEIYDPRTIFLIGLQYVNEGSTPAILLAATLTFLEMHENPQQATWYLIVITFPEVCSILWALLAEMFPFYGKRGHIVSAACL